MSIFFACDKDKKTDRFEILPLFIFLFFLLKLACTSSYTFRSFAESSSFFPVYFLVPLFLLYVVHITVCVIYKLSICLFVVFFRVSYVTSSISFFFSVTSFLGSFFCLSSSSSFSFSSLCISVLCTSHFLCFSVIFLHVRMQFPRDDPLQNKQTKKSIKAPQTNGAHDCFYWKGC